jgi:ribosome-binding ATPase YchF (GTP1/OBG family)
MKLCLFGISEVPLGIHNVKDPRLDQADQLVEAKKKVYVQAEVTDEKGLAEADAILVRQAQKSDLLMRDLEFIETRLSRDPSAAEQAVLHKLADGLTGERFVRELGLTDEERKAIAAHAFLTAKPVVVAAEGELEAFDLLLLRAYAEAGFFSFLTVGGKENRAWKIRQGASAWEAAGAIHTDIQKGFIRAEIISFADLVASGGETEAKRAGKQRVETKTYVMQDYDVVNFRFSK